MAATLESSVYSTLCKLHGLMLEIQKSRKIYANIMALVASVVNQQPDCFFAVIPNQPVQYGQQNKCKAGK